VGTHHSDSTSKYRVIVDGKAGKEFGAIVLGSLQFSADGRTVGYVASRVPYEDAHVVVGDQEYESCDQIENFGLGPLGKRVIYKAKKGKSEFAMVDGQRIDGAIAIAFGPQQQRIVTLVQDPKTRRVHVDIDGARSPEYDEIPSFDAAMQRFRGHTNGVLLARRGDQYFALRVAL
jgi:hypothetical protein